jgi:REP element-mobilizing transposase RayT
MPQSLAQLYLHIVFSTKNHVPFIKHSIRKELFDYIGGILNNIECHPIKIGGVDDHIHILCRLSKKITIIKLLEEIKTSSSKWIKTKGEEYAKFHWQDGYGAFTISPSAVDNIMLYIENQEEHHGHKEFKEEFIELLKSNNTDYDEQYLWD